MTIVTTGDKCEVAYALSWYQNHRPWMTLYGQNALWCRKGASFWGHCTN